MKICFFNLHAYALFNPKSDAGIGGTEIQLYYLAKYLAEDNDISFITGDWGQKDIEVIGGIKIRRSVSLEKNLLNYVSAPFVVWSALRRADSDVYIASSAGAEIGIIALFCKLNGKKFIYRTAHDWDCNGEFVKKYGAIGQLFRYGLLRAEAVVTQNNDHEKKLHENYGISAIVIRNSWEISEVPCEKKTYILWVARCEKWKNPELLIKTAGMFKNISFLMICPKSDGEYFSVIRKDAKDQKNIIFMEGVPFIEIQPYFNEARLFIGTSDYEGFPNTYLQACLAGTPIVSYKVNPDGFITKNNLGYCADGNFEKMIGYIEKILKDEESWKEKSENAFWYVKKNHDINIVGKQWDDLLQGLVKN